jgi:hypothetical protein
MTVVTAVEISPSRRGRSDRCARREAEVHFVRPPNGPLPRGADPVAVAAPTLETSQFGCAFEPPRGTWLSATGFGGRLINDSKVALKFHTCSWTLAPRPHLLQRRRLASSMSIPAREAAPQIPDPGRGRRNVLIVKLGQRQPGTSSSTPAAGRPAPRRAADREVQRASVWPRRFGRRRCTSCPCAGAGMHSRLVFGGWRRGRCDRSSAEGPSLLVIVGSAQRHIDRNPVAPDVLAQASAPIACSTRIVRATSITVERLPLRVRSITR